MQKRILVSAVVVAGLIGTAGCGSSSKSSSATVAATTLAATPGTTGTTTGTTAATTGTIGTTAGTTATTAGTTAGAGALKLGSSCKGGTPTGATIKIVDIADAESASTGTPGAKAAVAALNACGGVNGHPVALVTCLSNGDQNQALKCANDAAADSTVIAAGGMSNGYGDLTDPVFEKAGIPITGLIGPGRDATSPNFFGTIMGSLITAAGAGYAVKELHLKVVNVPYLDFGNFGKAALDNVTNLVTKPSGLAAPTGVPIEFTETNFPGKVEAIGNPDVIVPALTPDLFVSLMNEARTAGHTYPAVFNTSVLANADIKQITNPGDIYVLSQYKLSGEGYDLYAKDFAAAGSDVAADNGQSIQAWLSVRLIADVMTQVGPSVTRKSLLDALTNLKAYDTGGLTPVLDFTAKDAAKTFANIINPAVVYYKVADGKLTPIDGEKFHTDLITIP